MDGDAVPDLKKFETRHKTAYPIAIDQGGKVYNYFGNGIPTSILIDRRGIIRAIHLGFEPKSFANERTHFLNLLPRAGKR